MAGSSTQGIKVVLHPVSDLERAKPLYTALLGVGPQGMTSPVTFWEVSDIEAKLAELTAAGATVKEAAHDVGGGRLVATVTDADGNDLGLLQDP